MQNYILKNECRVCHNKNLTLILNLNNQPLANEFHINNKTCVTYPLELMLCDNCFHAQLSCVVNPNLLFKNYIYVSGTSHTLLQYFDWFCDKTIAECEHNTSKKVLEIACNDGSQLDCYKMKGWSTYGCDPAENLGKISKDKGHNITVDFWNTTVADSYIEKGVIFDIIIMQNVLAHTDDVHMFLQACYKVMHYDSKLYIQTSQANMIKNNEFDTIYHEHLSYFSAKSLKYLVEANNLYITNIETTPIHGVSYLVTVMKRQNTVMEQKIVDNFITEELHDGRYSLETYVKYSRNCNSVVANLNTFINTYKKNNTFAKIIGYGAAAKGNTVLNFGNISLDYIIDDNPLKLGLFTPGTNIRITNIDELEKDLWCSILIVPLAWNFFDEIFNKVKNKVVGKKCNITFVKYFPDIQCVMV